MSNPIKLLLHCRSQNKISCLWKRKHSHTEFVFKITQIKLKLVKIHRNTLNRLTSIYSTKIKWLIYQGIFPIRSHNILSTCRSRSWILLASAALSFQRFFCCTDRFPASVVSFSTYSPKGKVNKLILLAQWKKRLNMSNGSVLILNSINILTSILVINMAHRQL